MIERVVVLAAIWWVVAEGDLSSWPAAAVAIPCALVVAGRLGPLGLPRPRPVAFLRFLPYFFAAAVRGGVDVAMRAFARTPRIDPELLRYRLRLHDPAATVLFANAICLLPGTLAADIRDDVIVIHALDRSLSYDTIATLENHVAALFGMDASLR